MSVNPPLTEAGEPILQPGEQFTTSCAGVNFQVESGGGYPGNTGSYYGKGNVYLTDRRVILVTYPLARHFQGFELPFLQVTYEKLTSSLFSGKTLSGVVDPTPGAGLVDVGEWKIVFSKGGAEAFFEAMTENIERVRSDPSQFARSVAVACAEAAAVPRYRRLSREEEAMSLMGPIIEPTSPKAYIDPSDPTHLFVPASTSAGLPEKNPSPHGAT